VEEGRRPGISIAAVALAHGVNANLLRKWIQDAEAPKGGERPAKSAEFVEVPLLPAPAKPTPAKAAPTKPATPLAEIRIEVRRGPMTVTMTWPSQAASECASWLREWLR
jgi:transposase-like protein